VQLRFTGNATRAQFDDAVASVGYWYHAFEFDNGYRVRGDYDIGRNVDEYRFGDVAGLQVLDVGTASGWFAFYFEQRGADVTTFDLRTEGELDVFGGPRPTVHSDAEWVKGAAVMADLLESKIKRVHGSVYELSPTLFDGRRFDLVFLGAILLHLRDPIGALTAARTVCRDRVVATSWYIPDEDPLGAASRPVADLPALSASPEGRSTWWRPNRPAYRLWFEAAGFTSVDVSRTVGLTADWERPEHFNSTQTLLLADARV
jgi:SAM-dependent methyltransferase